MASNHSSRNTRSKTDSAELPAINNPPSSALPAFMQGVESGKDSYDATDLIIPRVTLLQGISPAVMAGEAPNGHFWHTINEIDLGDSLRVVPILHRKQVTLWNPLHMGGGVVARASDGLHWDNDFDAHISPYKDMPKKLVRYTARKGDSVGLADVAGSGLAAFGSADPDNPEGPPAATLSHIFLFRALDHLDLGPFVVFLQRSSTPVAKTLLSKVNLNKASMFGQVYTMACKVDKNKAGQEYNQYTFKADSIVQDEELFGEFHANYRTFKGASFRTNDEDAVDEGGESGAGHAPVSNSVDDKY